MASAYALVASSLLAFDTGSPTTGVSIPITGLTAGETLVGIDIRPANSLLYGLGINAGTQTGTLYVISTSTGAATAVGASGQITGLLGTDFGFDFNPTVDRIRVVTDTDRNLRLNPDTGAIAATDNQLAYSATDPNFGANPNVTAAAYTQPQGNLTTTLYGLDSGLDVLLIQNPPNNGALNTVAGVTFGGPLDFSGVNGFDIAASASGTVGTAFALLTVGGTAGLYSINLGTGVATFFGALGAGLPANGLAIQSNVTAPTITTSASLSAPENSVFVANLTSTDPDFAGTNPATFSITGGANAGLFTIATVAGAQQLQFVSPHDFEREAHSYTVQVTASDGLNTTPQTLTVTLTDVNGAPSFGAIVTDPNGTTGSVIRLFDAAFDRPGDLSGLQTWTDLIEGGGSPATVAAAFVASAEFTSRFGTLNNHDFVDLIYANALGRDSDLDPGSQSWLNALNSGVSRANVMLGISDSAEHRAITDGAIQAGIYVPNQEATDVAHLYYGLLGRAPDASGLQAFVNQEEGGRSLSSIAADFLGSPEFGALHPGTFNNHDYVASLYTNALGRSSDLDAGSQNWISALNAGVSRADVAVGISESAEAIARLAPAIEDGILFA